jgi:FkbM family methyltransferase
LSTDLSTPISTAPAYEPDAWIYTRTTLGWLFDPKLTRQLPWLYQIFSIYGKGYFSLTGKSDLAGGRALFQQLVKLLQKFSPGRYLKFKLTSCSVFLDPFDARFFQVVNELTQTDADPRVLNHLLKPGDTFIDIGANHGSFSIVASQLVGASGLVVAVEPQPRLYQAVEQSLAANALGKFQVYPVAVGDREGEIELLMPQGTSGSAGIYAAHSGTHAHRSVTVPLKRFADLVDWPSFPGKAVIKLDIEGSEPAFLAGAAPLIVALRPPLIMEIHPGTLQASQTTAAQMKQQLQDLGYTDYAEMQRLDRRVPIGDLDTAVQRNVVLFMAD